MSERGIRRAHERALSKRARRAAASTGVAIGAAALLAPAANAANFPVTTTANAGAGSLRTAVANANAAGGPDNITFTGAGASGTIRLTTGEIAITDDVTITGPGAATLAVSGDVTNNGTTFATTVNQGDSRIFAITDPTAPGSPVQQVTITGLTLRDGVADLESGGTYTSLSGGALYSEDSAVTLDGMNFINNVATEDGGAVALGDNDGRLSVSNSTFTNNRAKTGGGAIFVEASKYGPGSDVDGVRIVNSQLTDNQAGGTVFGAFGNSPGPAGGGLLVKYSGPTVIDSTTISNNTALTNNGGSIDGIAGGAQIGGGNSVVSNSTISGNVAGSSAGGAFLQGVKLENSTVSANSAPDTGGGLIVTQKYGGGPSRIDNSTISGNSVTGTAPYEGRGGGVAAIAYSTNTAVIARNSTIASNAAGTAGGGIEILTGETPSDPLAELKSTLVADNIAAGSPNDLGAYAPPGESTAGILSAGFSLVETPGAVTPLGDPGSSNIFGVDPGLGALALNGGTTRTHDLSPTSAAIDAAQANAFTADQRGQARTVDAAAVNNVISDGTDIGAFELQDAGARGDDDVASPETKITKKPKKKLKGKGKKKTAKAKFEFTGTDNVTGAEALTFQCKIDKGAFDTCVSPFKVTLKKGSHTFSVKATDGAGNVDSSPATATTKVTVKKKKGKGGGK